MSTALGLARAAFVHHADPLGVHQLHRVLMMHECSAIRQGCMDARGRQKALHIKALHGKSKLL